MERALFVLAVFQLLQFMGTAANAQTQCMDQGVWQTQKFLGNSGSSTDAIENPLLLTDGRVLVQYVGSAAGKNQYQDWYALKPDQYGCYSTGSITCNATWSQLASLTSVWGGTCAQGGQQAYGPSDGFASAVLSDGNVIIEGGEDNCGMGLAFTPMGALYNSQSAPGTWTAVNPPTDSNGPWQAIGDAASVVLSNGTFMVAACGAGAWTCGTTGYEQALFNESNFSWTITGANKFDNNTEENWVLLPGGTGPGPSKVLVVDVWYSYINQLNYDYSETYDPLTGSWSSAGTTAGPPPLQIWGVQPAEPDIGPSILLPSGKVWATGSVTSAQLNPPAGAYTAIYDPSLPVGSRWSAGPRFGTVPVGGNNVALGAGDSPAAVLPDGNVLIAAGTKPNTGMSYFLEWDGQSQSFCSINNVPMDLASRKPASINMVVLPTGQVLMTTNTATLGAQLTQNYYIYTPGSNQFNSAWQPVITSVTGTLNRGATYPISGMRFNGMTQASFYGDDYEGASNYPLVQITDSAGHKFFARTHDHSTMGVATGNLTVSTMFDVPTATSGIATGTASVIVIANGIASTAVQVTIQ
jgi:hypothetical protein